MATDFVGNEISVNDEVLIVEPKYHHLVEAVVCKITPKGFTVEYYWHGYLTTTNRAKHQIVKINIDNTEWA